MLLIRKCLHVSSKDSGHQYRKCSVPRVTSLVLLHSTTRFLIKLIIPNKWYYCSITLTFKGLDNSRVILVIKTLRTELTSFSPVHKFTPPPLRAHRTILATNRANSNTVNSGSDRTSWCAVLTVDRRGSTSHGIPNNLE